MHVRELTLYPLKSARGVSLQSSEIDSFGLVGDRRAMIVDPNGQAITQREMPLLARLDVEMSQGTFHLGMDDKPAISVRPNAAGARLDVDIWKTIVNAAVAEDESNHALSEWLGREIKIVIFDEHSQRTAEEDWAGDATPVSFSDGFQILVTTTGSLSALNADLAAHGEAQVGMDRFRPNIVIDCDEPWQEDRWAAISIGGIRFDLVKPCARCIMTTQDQKTGSRDGANPMPAMGRLRMSADRRVPGPLFGWNAVPRGSGSIAIGDAVECMEERREGWAFKQR
ncbi:MOSC domain-containing protein [Rhizobium sp. HT1-10]|uniref:MOSC domain-containing protein n=1 Tax=Rhizobium sp. HT1-10 TaxID=3111638 RepID=UPI003C1EE420